MIALSYSGATLYPAQEQALVIVRGVAGKTGEIRVLVEANGFKPATLVVKSLK